MGPPVSLFLSTCWAPPASNSLSHGGCMPPTRQSKPALPMLGASLLEHLAIWFPHADRTAPMVHELVLSGHNRLHLDGHTLPMKSAPAAVYRRSRSHWMPPSPSRATVVNVQRAAHPRVSLSSNAFHRRPPELLSPEPLLSGEDSVMMIRCRWHDVLVTHHANHAAAATGGGNQKDIMRQGYFWLINYNGSDE
jgi:hypothetical protein